MAHHAGAALHRKAGRLVQHQHVVVFVQRHCLQRGERLRFGFRFGRNLRRIQPQRRNADVLAGLQPVLAVGALAVHAQLAFADDALDMGERQPRKPRFEEAVDAHVVLVRRHHDGLDFGRQRRCVGDDLLGLGNKRRRLCRAGRREARGLAAGAMRRRMLSPQLVPVGRCAPRTLTPGSQWLLDATAHAVLPNLRDADRPARRGSAATSAPISLSARRNS